MSSSRFNNVDPLQVCFPLGRVAMTIYGVLATVVFSGFIVYDTNKLLKRHAYNQYVVAAISLYLDVINLFMAQMAISFQ
jgi:protein lifeguard